VGARKKSLGGGGLRHDTPTRRVNPFLFREAVISKKRGQQKGAR